MRGETSIHMESPRPKRPFRPPTPDDSREPTDYVIIDRTHSAEIANHLLEVQTPMSRLEEENNEANQRKRKIRPWWLWNHHRMQQECSWHSYSSSSGSVPD